jgi:solute carrier family 35 protein E1
MLACSASFKGNIVGILCAFLAALIFVTQNIFSKRLFNEAAKAEAEGMHVHSKKLDKLNLLCYCSGLAFILTLPIWAWSEGFTLLSDFMHDGAVDLTSKPNTFDHGRLFVEFIFNGTFHFGQNIIAFVLLSMVSPVTYSVASLIKRVFVVVIAIIWFQNPTTPMQGLGIALTFFGLYLYDRTSDSNKADKRARLMDIKEEPILPTLNTRVDTVKSYASPGARSGANPYAASNGSNGAVDEKAAMEAGVSRGRPRGTSAAVWLPPGTKAEETWRAGEGVGGLQGRVVAMGHNLP